ncbi:hypothetical protein ACFX1Q_016035 [Malus domestica]
MPTLQRGNIEKDMNNGQFGNRCKGFPIINTFNLTISFRNKPSFVPFKTAIMFKLHFVDPFAANGTSVGVARA